MLIEMQFKVSGAPVDMRGFLAALMAGMETYGVAPAVRVSHGDLPAPLREATNDAPVIDPSAFMEQVSAPQPSTTDTTNVEQISRRPRGRPRTTDRTPLAPVTTDAPAPLTTEAPAPSTHVASAPVASPAPVQSAPEARPVPEISSATGRDEKADIERATKLLKTWVKLPGQYNGQSRANWLMNLLTKHGATSATAVPPQNRDAWFADMEAAIAASNAPAAAPAAAPVATPAPAAPVAVNNLFD